MNLNVPTNDDSPHNRHADAKTTPLDGNADIIDQPVAQQDDTSAEARNPVPWWARNSARPLLAPDQVRLRSARGVLGMVAFGLALIAGMWWILSATAVKDVEKTDFGFYAYKQSTNALIGGCGPMYVAPAGVVEKASGTVPATDKTGIANQQTYTTVVPMFGPFWDDPADKNQSFWSRTEPNIPQPENLLRNMWDGAMVVYYTQSVSPEDVQTLKDVVRLHPEMDIKVVPWDEDVRGPLPQYRQVAFATWNASQSCHQLIAPALYDFRKLHPASDAPGYDGTEPPVLSTHKPVSVVR